MSKGPLPGLPDLPDYKSLGESICPREGERSVEGAHQLMGFLESVQSHLHGALTRYPGLGGLFEEEFGQSFGDFVAEDNVLALVLVEGALFSGHKMPYGPEGGEVDGEALEEYGQFFREWAMSKGRAHERCQARLKEHFREEMRMGQLECSCLHCIPGI